ncbi:kelch repeat and BTB domain-containing protein 2-like [Amphiura filiformis]|uniref:kelch repeat and BTB domain-containing protein 2-like n=1 Tax=Amphiura filiformis TaxID=82378 RepID=UPI003B216E26
MARMEQEQCLKQMGDPSHLSHLSSGLNQLRHQAAFCDVTIIVGDQRFPAHKAVLSCASDYFQGMFTSGFQESTMSEITVPGTEESFAQILDFAYTGHFTLSLRTVVGILKMACYMVMTKTVELCAEYLKDVKDKLTIEDCFEIWLIASNHKSLSNVAQIYRSHVIQNMVKCVKSKVFLENSSVSVMMEILSDEEIETDTTTEEQILQGTVMWLKYDWEQRKVHAVDLLKKIRLGLVPVDRLQEILGDEIMAIPECKEMAEEVVKLSVTKDTALLPLIKSHPDLFATRNNITAKLRVIHGDDESQALIPLKCRTEAACFRLTKFSDIPCPYEATTEEYGSGINLFVPDSGHLYAAGGCVWFEDDDPEKEELYETWLSENNFFRYDSVKNEWIVLSPMPVVLYFPLMFQFDEYIYLLGVGGPEQVIERYCISSKTWEIVEDDLYLHPFPPINCVQKHNIMVVGIAYVEGPNQQGGDGGIEVFKTALYRPATNELLEVSVDRDMGRDSHFEMHNSVCYLVTKGGNHEPDEIYRCICDLDSDSPTIIIAEEVTDEQYETIQELREDMNSVEFTFDKRNLGMIEMPCECASHVKDKSTMQEYM